MTPPDFGEELPVDLLRLFSAFYCPKLRAFEWEPSPFFLRSWPVESFAILFRACPELVALDFQMDCMTFEPYEPDEYDVVSFWRSAQGLELFDENWGSEPGSPDEVTFFRLSLQTTSLAAPPVFRTPIRRHIPGGVLFASLLGQVSSFEMTPPDTPSPVSMQPEPKWSPGAHSFLRHRHSGDSSQMTPKVFAMSERDVSTQRWIVGSMSCAAGPPMWFLAHELPVTEHDDRVWSEESHSMGDGEDDRFASSPCWRTAEDW
ncbi:hypothetical protein BDK51DRAFT_43467 [Blyttiomyces helicus]|uniref:Uncharacterized protein n=1 Tax=Blyttiomyces helicus TaxID=388810 RepID=A0A4P9WE84_9FUNG|nr:hypothetical protein BDK51DRAFT_43467 [Blyttiomyces helicus]|eukprot:RKO90692.1 hypothetical protein BDK51DRAFT_43467 [Blyttiomyces helicus]